MGFIFKIIQRIIVPLLIFAFIRSLARDLGARGWQSYGPYGQGRNSGRTGGSSYRRQQSQSWNSGQGSGSSTDFNWNASPWDVLGLSRSATNEEIHARYRELIVKYHPDKFAGMNDPDFSRLAAQKFQRIQAAYDELRRLRGF